MNECIFCKIIKGEIPSRKLYEDEYLYAFYDINPAAAVHFLVIPKEHIPSIDAISEKNSKVTSKVFEIIPQLAKLAGIKNGYRVISNCGEDAGQTVPHLHFHIVGGEKLPVKIV